MLMSGSTVVACGPRGRTPQVTWLPVMEPQILRSLGVGCARTVAPLPCVCRIRIGIDRSLGPACWMHRRMLLEYDFQWS